MKGLIILPNWADLILENEKGIEIRGSKVKLRETIGIIKSGSKKVFGTVELYDCIELTEERFNEWKHIHRFDKTYEELLKIYQKPYAWFLRNAVKYDEPVSYEHKLGCVIWVNL